MGCADFIDVHPENSATYTNYFKTKKDAEALLTDLQWRIKTTWTTDDLSRVGYIVDDDPSADIPNKLEPSRMLSIWSGEYGIIYQANLILDNAHRFEISEEELQPYLLQAYFAKGVAYFYLAMKFGEAPITQGSINFDKYPQSSTSEVLNEAEKWALKAMDLPKYEDLAGNSSGNISRSGGGIVESSGELGARMKQYGSKGATAALLAHLYAWRAGVEGKSEYWKKAEEYCRMIIDGEVGNYRLATDPEEVCTSVMHRDSEESIWEIYCNGEELPAHVQRYMPFVGFPVITLSSHTPDNTWQPSIYKTTVNRMYPEGDRRRDAYFWETNADSVYLKYMDGEVVASAEREQDSVIVAYDNQSIKRAYLYKFRYPFYLYYDYSPEPQLQGMNQNKVIWRLAEIYLLRAECRARQGKANAVDDLNTVRRRAYGDDSHAFPCAEDVENGLAENIQLAIFREREKELLHEGHRYYDIVRNGMCYLRGEDTHDYIREEISEAYSRLTDQDIQDGALYYGLEQWCFENNDLLRQNRYWNRRMQ